MDNNEMNAFTNSDDILQDIRAIIDVARESAYQAVNLALVRRNWLLGKRISEEELKNSERAEYGMEVIKSFQKHLPMSTEKDLLKQTYTAFILFIKPFRRFSTQRVENLKSFSLGHIIGYCFKLKIQLQENGMPKKLPNRHGQYGRCSAILTRSITTDCCHLRISSLLSLKWSKNRKISAQ